MGRGCEIWDEFKIWDGLRCVVFVAVDGYHQYRRQYWLWWLMLWCVFFFFFLVAVADISGQWLIFWGWSVVMGCGG